MAGKNREIVLRPQAQRDLDKINKYSPPATDKILKKIELLAEFPAMGPEMDRAYEGFRQILSGNYRIIYEIMSENRVEIAYIRHCAQQMGLRLVQSPH